MENIVEIRPIETKKWHGKQKEENFTRPKRVGALVDGQRMVYCTGLTEEEEKKYSDILKEDLGKQFNHKHAHPFWDSQQATLVLENSTTFLYIDRPLDYIKYKIAKASKFIANSIKEYQEGMYPEATHVLFDEKQEADSKAAKVVAKNKVIKLADELSLDRKIQILLILTGKNLKKQSNNFVLVEMDKLIEAQPDEVLRYIQMEDKAAVAAYALVLECIQKGILKKEKQKIFFHEIHLGDDPMTVAEYLSKDENQELKLRLMRAVTD